MLLKIFLLEDQALFRDLIVRTLRQSLDIEIVGSFGAADELLAHLDAVRAAQVGLLDVRLGASDCFDLLPKLAVAAPQTRLMWVTSVLEDVLLQRALDAHLPGFVHKDDSAEELITAVQRVAAGDTFTSRSVQQFRQALRKRSDVYSKVLSAREQEIVKLVGSGFSNHEVGAMLGISVHTVKTHRRNIMARLDLHSATELQAYAIRRGFVSPSSLR